MEIRIGVAHKSQRCQASLLDGDSKFLFEFANERLLRRFAGLDLAAGKFPQAGHRSPFGALGKQNASITVDERTGGDENQFDAHSSTLLATIAGTR
jgi:hypothetical protein